MLFFSFFLSLSPVYAAFNEDASTSSHLASKRPLDPRKKALSTTLHQYEHWIGDDYSLNALLQAGWAKRFFFDRYAFKGNENILDIGCGDGKITSNLARQAPNGRTIGIDQSSTMVQRGSSTYSSLPNLTFLNIQAQDTSFYEEYQNSFDLVVSFTALHWVKEQDEVLKGVHTALKAGGKLYFRLCSDGADPVYEISNEFTHHPNYVQHFKEFVDPLNRFSAADYKERLHAAGFEMISVMDVEDRDEFDDIDSLKKQVKSHLPHYHFLRDKGLSEIAETFIEDLVSEYIKRIPSVNSKIVLIDHYLEMEASRL